VGLICAIFVERGLALEKVHTGRNVKGRSGFFLKPEIPVDILEAGANIVSLGTVPPRYDKKKVFTLKDMITCNIDVPFPGVSVPLEQALEELDKDGDEDKNNDTDTDEDENEEDSD
jgi:hypothetical protein